jgi:CheY-like chemotaxis protein
VKHLRGKRLLVVDDLATNRLILERQTRGWGMEPTLASSGDDALALLRAGATYDLAILDGQMPVMDGITLAREIRRLRTRTELPLVLLTSMGRPLEEESRQLFETCLVKPVKADQMQQMLLGLFGSPADALARPSAPGVLDPELGKRHPLRILVAEDNMVNQKVALATLARMGYRADLAGNGLEALEAVARQPYDVVLMDVQMPELDGLGASRRLVELYPPGARPRIVAMTAGAMDEDRQECLAAGMDEFLTKPVRGDALARTLEACPRRPDAPRPGSRGDVPVVTEAAPPTPGAPAPSPPPAPAPDVTEGLAEMRTMLGDELVSELVGIYLEDTPSLVSAIREAVAAGDGVALKRAAHGLKGCSANLNLRALAELCAVLERRGAEQQAAGATEPLERLASEYGRIRAALEAALHPEV